jgi:RNA polymerase sigma-70 factor (ECF subfamily)
MASPAIPDDRDGFRRLYEAHGDAMFRMLHRLTRNAHDAEDLVQESFTTLWRKRRQFRGEGSLEGYLRRIAYRTYLNARGRLARARSPAPLHDGQAASREGDPAPRVERASDERLLLDRVRRAVDALPDSWREPFVLFRYEGLTCAEVAEAMGITTKAAELRLARALEAVSKEVADLRTAYGEATA